MSVMWMASANSSRAREHLLSLRIGEEILKRGLMPVLSFRDRNAVRLLRLQSIADPPAALATIEFPAETTAREESPRPTRSRKLCAPFLSTARAYQTIVVCPTSTRRMQGNHGWDWRLGSPRAQSG